METKKDLDLLETEIFVNEKYTGIKTEVGYDIFFDHKLNQFVAILSLMNEETPKGSPKEIRWDCTKKIKENSLLIDSFTDEEVSKILSYRGLNLDAGFFLGDVFMYGEHMKLVK